MARQGAVGLVLPDTGAGDPTDKVTTCLKLWCFMVCVILRKKKIIDVASFCPRLLQNVSMASTNPEITVMGILKTTVLDELN